MWAESMLGMTNSKEGCYLLLQLLLQQTAKRFISYFICCKNS